MPSSFPPISILFFSFFFILGSSGVTERECWLFVSDDRRITSSRSGRIALCPTRRTSQVCWSNVESEMRLRNSFPSSRKNLIPTSRNEHRCFAVACRRLQLSMKISRRKRKNRSLKLSEERKEREREKEGREEKALKSLFLNDEGKFLFSILF